MTSMNLKYQNIIRGLLLIALIFSGVRGQDTSIAEMEIGTKLKRIDSLLQYLSKNNQFNGSFLYGTNDTIYYNKAFGYLNSSKGSALSERSLFEIASITKTLTSTLTFAMIERGYFELETNLNVFFPELPYKTIKIKHLLNHTSGLPDYYDSIVQPYWGKKGNLNNNKLVQLFAKYKPSSSFQPGEKFEYSNTGFILLASALERVSGKSYDQLMKELVFNPAKMNDSKRRIFSADNPNLAVGHRLSVGQGRYLPLSEHEEFPLMLHSFYSDSKGPGSIISSTSDLFRFCSALKAGKILNNKSLDKMWSVGELNSGKRTNYAYGWQKSQGTNDDLIHHRGGTEGYNSFMFHSINRNYTYILLSNFEQPYLSKINRAIQHILEGKKPERIPISGVERIALLLNGASDEQLENQIRPMRSKDDFYFTLTEFNSLAWKYWLRKDFETALKILRIATVAMSDNAGVWEVLAEAYMELEQPNKSIPLYEKTIKMLQNDPDKKDKKWAKEWIVDMQNNIQRMKLNLK